MEIPFLSFQQKRILSEAQADLSLWQGPSLEDLWQMPDPVNKTTINREYRRVVDIVDSMRREPADYDNFVTDYDFSGRNPQIEADFKSPETIMGRCPCPKDGEETRCCNLKTLDAIQQCRFACSYCSIQAFYSNNRIKVVSDLSSKLNSLELESGTWHIGTGQSSDSLALADDYGTLTALFGFAAEHPEIILELKTKSARTDWLSLEVPPNVVSTWSVNADEIVRREEHLAASLDARIKAASITASKGHAVGFHIHPMVYYTRWKEGYSDLVHRLCDNIDPKSVVLVGIGTLTFTKSNLKVLRESGRPTLVTKMPLDPIAGKYSYSLETKKQMFSYVYDQFPQDWKDEVFFYLCMEDPSLWSPCLGRSYSCNSDFEQDMKARYFKKISQISGR